MPPDVFEYLHDELLSPKGRCRFFRLGELFLPEKTLSLSRWQDQSHQHCHNQSFHGKTFTIGSSTGLNQSSQSYSTQSCDIPMTVV